jgi:hypothetical protein
VLNEIYTLAGRHGERGSRRALHEESDNYEGMLTEQNGSQQAPAELLRAGARGLPEAAPRARLEAMAEVSLLTRAAMASALRRRGERRRI